MGVGGRVARRGSMMIGEFLLLVIYFLVFGINWVMLDGVALSVVGE